MRNVMKTWGGEWIVKDRSNPNRTCRPHILLPQYFGVNGPIRFPSILTYP
ncbi:hypothetical protein J7E26_07920 [Bacillus sp. ISL-51]|nr:MULTISPECIES: hypothetical protein [Bacteria]MBT2573878.1 hypothetical protein [Bacillus sp. ISL-51]MBT2634790.1 hypothetical protein [Bacillus sp. ISL-26]MBT2712266.1 hypothetical protein [Pseudomonas sp. ISL-88]